jgi:hypothetical protein
MATNFGQMIKLTDMYRQYQRANLPKDERQELGNRALAVTELRQFRKLLKPAKVAPK